jgi:hypothetical protein
LKPIRIGWLRDEVGNALAPFLGKAWEKCSVGIFYNPAGKRSGKQIAKFALRRIPNSRLPTFPDFPETGYCKVEVFPDATLDNFENCSAQFRRFITHEKARIHFKIS